MANVDLTVNHINKRGLTIKRLKQNGDSLIVNSNVIGQLQQAPAAYTGADTVTIANMLLGINTLNQSTGGTVALTVDTGALIEAGLPDNFSVDDSFDFSIINLSSAGTDTGTLTAAAGVTLVGNMVIDADSTGQFRVRKTADDTYTIYRL